MNAYELAERLTVSLENNYPSIKDNCSMSEIKTVLWWGLLDIQESNVKNDTCQPDLFLEQDV
jgi:hypothetical protein